MAEKRRFITAAPNVWFWAITCTPLPQKNQKKTSIDSPAAVQRQFCQGISSTKKAHPSNPGWAFFKQNFRSNKDNVPPFKPPKPPKPSKPL